MSNNTQASAMGVVEHILVVGVVAVLAVGRLVVLHLQNFLEEFADLAMP